MIGAVFYGLTAAFFWGTADFISRIPSRRIGYYLSSGYSQLLGFVEIATVVLIFQSLILPNVFANGPVLVAGLLVGVASFVAITFLYRGFTTGIMSVVSPIVSAYPLVTIVLSVLLLGQVLTSVKALGVSAVLIGIGLVGIRLRELKKPVTSASSSLSNSERRTHSSSESSLKDGSETLLTHRFYRGVSPAIVACFASGLMAFGLGFVTPVLGAFFPILLVRGVGALISFTLLVPLKQRFEFPNASTFLWLGLVSLFDTVGLLAFNFGILVATHDLPTLVTLSGLLSLVTIILARIFYHERLDKIQVLGMILLFGGVATLLYS